MKALKRIREARGISLKNLSESTGIGKSTIGNYENGRTSMSPDFLKTVADFLSLPVESIDEDVSVYTPILPHGQRSENGMREMPTGVETVDWKARAIAAETKLAQLRRLLDDPADPVNSPPRGRGTAAAWEAAAKVAQLVDKKPSVV